MNRELIVITKLSVGKFDTSLAATPDTIAATPLNLRRLLDDREAMIEPLFDGPKIVPASWQGPHLSQFHVVHADDKILDGLASELRALDFVEAAYVRPDPEPAVFGPPPDPNPEEPPLITPLFSARQTYLGAIQVDRAWMKKGGRGTGVNVIDAELAWQLTHEDLQKNHGGIVIGYTPAGWKNDHGTAVLGIFHGDRNALGISGICSSAYARAASFLHKGNSRPNYSKTIKKAADLLSAGDILILEIHIPGPRYNYQQREDQKGYIAIEWWPDPFAAIQYATCKEVITVEAGGNGREDLSDSIYDKGRSDFPSDWINPFRRGRRDSRAIIVGAGASFPTKNNNDPVERSRLYFSNYGELFDAQAMGEKVVTCGYGDLQSGSDPNRYYSKSFGGTSSATPIVAGALAEVQGILKQRRLPLLTPRTARQLLRQTGAKQTDADGRPKTQRIGNRPNLQQMLDGTAVVLSFRQDNKLFYLSEKDLGLRDKWQRAGNNPDDYNSQIVSGNCSDGRLALLAVGAERDSFPVFYLVESNTKPNNLGTPWAQGGDSRVVAGKISVANFSDSRLGVFVVDRNTCKLWYLLENETNPGELGQWVEATPAVQDFSRELAMQNFSDGRLAAFAIANDSRYVAYLTEKDAKPGEFMAEWRHTNAVARNLSQIVAGKLSDGRAVVFAVDIDGQLWQIQESVEKSGTLGQWQRLPGGPSWRLVATGRFSDSRLGVFAVPKYDYGLSFTLENKTYKPGTFSDWNKINAKYQFHGLSISNSADGKLICFVRQDGKPDDIEDKPPPAWPGQVEFCKETEPGTMTELQITSIQRNSWWQAITTGNFRKQWPTT